MYDRGTLDQVPENFFSDCLNLNFEVGEWKTRAGLSGAITLGYASGKVRRFAAFSDVTIGPLVLILDEAGNFYTASARTGDNATTPRFTVASATDFSAIKMLGKIYIAVHDGQFGLSGQNLRVFIPHATTIASDEFRSAAGAAPSAGGAMGAANGAAGLVNAGTYKIAVAYITTSGFITPPGPKVASVFTPTTYVAPGSVKINLSSILTGPSGTAKRQILITKAGLEEYYFLPSTFGGLISDNTTTTTTLDFDDTTDLVDSADYLFDLLETIPSPLGLQTYSGRLCTFGEGVNPSIIRASLVADPESFDSVDGIVTVEKDDGFTIRNGITIRDVLYAWKNLGVYSIRDNNDIPANWPVSVIDQSVNVGIHGIAEFFDMSGIRMARDWILLADKAGILLFDGIVRKPPITDNINDIWQTINYNQYHKIVLAVDEQNHKIYCAIPTGSATDNDVLLMADYKLCAGNVPSSQGIKFTKWQLNPGGALKGPTEIGLFGYPPDTVPTLKIGSVDGGGKIWKLDPSVTTDDGTAIESYFETSLLLWDAGAVHFFTAARLRIVGSGTLLCTITGEDAVLTGSLPSITLAASPGVEKLIRFNFQNEKARLKFRLTSGYFTVSKVEIFGKQAYSMRPA